MSSLPTAALSGVHGAVAIDQFRKHRNGYQKASALDHLLHRRETRASLDRPPRVQQGLAPSGEGAYTIHTAPPSSRDYSSVGTVVIGLVIINALNCVGAFTSIEDIFWPYKIFAYILPPHFVFQSIAYMVFHDSDDFAGTEVATNATTAGREALASGRNFYCPDNVCFGRTGDEILQQLNVRSHSHNSSLPRHPRCQHP